MNAQKRKRKSRKPLAPPPPPPSVPEQEAVDNSQWWREAIESITIAIVLALLFRAFEAEAFVIPTGSMAPTLQGRHKDVRCPQCNYRYQAGASLENESHHAKGLVVEVHCPMCRYAMPIDRGNANLASFTGDRILVNKFTYQFSDPQRWDVIVFKYPGNAKQNYIKRLVGLPGETLKVHHGDAYAKGSGAEEFTILRKPPHKIPYLLHPVHDTSYIPEILVDGKWPQGWHNAGGGSAQSWDVNAEGTKFALQPSPEVSWLQYRHLPPTREDWRALARGEQPPDLEQRAGMLISDYYAYNDYRHMEEPLAINGRSGWHWVGDLALECVADVQSADGELLLDVVEGGTHFTCTIDVSSGQATVRAEDGQVEFNPVGDQQVTQLLAETRLRGPGRYRLRWANLDDQLLLWVNDRLVQFTAHDQEHPGHYTRTSDARPRYSPADPGDLYPARVGGANIDVTLTRLRVLRDIYYIAASSGQASHQATDYDTQGRLLRIDQVLDIFAKPQDWARTSLFDMRSSVEFELGEDQFFPMGDNNPQSKDARLWGGQQHSYHDPRGKWVDSCVERDMLIGKAFLVYWPHGWNPGNIHLPFIPNVSRMERIR